MIFSRKKQRGQWRKLNTLIKNIDAFVPFKWTNESYEHFHVSSSPFISQLKTSGKVKTAFCEKWLETAEKFIEQKPAELPFCKVVCVIDAYDLWSSQIIIFYSKDYYDSFWDRQGPEQKWECIDDKSISFVKSRSIKTNLMEKGYYETICEDDFCRKSILWFYGELER